MKRIGLVLAMVAGLGIESAVGGVRVVSVYLESLATLQAQAFLAAQLFESPELGMVPMMMMMVPGLAQIDRDAHVGLHVFSDGADKGAGVIDIMPAVSAEAFLGAFLTAQGGQVPEAVEGRFVSDKGVAQVHGNRLLLAQSADQLDLALSVGIPSEMPALPGLLRYESAPANLVKILDGLSALMDENMPAAEAQKDMLKRAMAFYRSGFAQIARYEYALGISANGLEIRSKLQPQAGRALAGVVASLQGVDPGWVAHLTDDQVFGVVSGAYSVPGDVLQRLVGLYADMIRSMPEETGIDPEFIPAMFEPTLSTIGAPSFLFGGLQESGAFAFWGGTLLPAASDVLQKMVGLITGEAYQGMLVKSGIKISEPVVRDVDGVLVHRWSMLADEETFMQLDGGPLSGVGAEQMAFLKHLLQSVLSGYDYAATDKGLVFGMGDENSVVRAMSVMNEAGQGTVTTHPILERIGAPLMPYAVGRFDLIGILRAIAKLGEFGEALKAFDAKGEGVVFGAWRAGNDIEQLVMVPASDIRALRKAFQPVKK
jgi:hypothetical protein